MVSPSGRGVPAVTHRGHHRVAHRRHTGCRRASRAATGDPHVSALPGAPGAA
ncbi:hypothetical protein Ae263Ps1_5797 [Pseudonocardia sp. Ae263_Ps1]|nr:hypothetical protein Ae150APs1_5528c [Pseudonocardia sp. Ae150A_Ps1]OLL88742.1 hypothetical protein Ae263Ps1_5797 [Pseudonocardia sp. Ae263_Ps1]